MTHSPDLLEEPFYAPVTYIGRTVHLEDYLKICSEKKLQTKPVNVMSDCSNLVGHDVLWFGPCNPPEAHDWYGNINFRINFDDFLEYFNYKGHVVNNIEYKTCSATRVLFTNKSIVDLPKDIKPLNIHKFGSPIYMRNGNLYHVTDYKRKSGDYNINGHQVEIIIEPTEEDAAWLFEESKIIPVNHSEANESGHPNFTYRPKSCRYHHISNRKCPFPFTVSETRDMMKKIDDKILAESNEVSTPTQMDE